MLKLTVLERYGPAHNISRFYVFSIEPSLYGEATLVREWGRKRTLGQRRIEVYDNKGRAAKALETWLRRKQRRGYRIR